MHRCTDALKEERDKSKKYDIMDLMRKDLFFSRQESATFRGIFDKGD